MDAYILMSLLGRLLNVGIQQMMRSPGFNLLFEQGAF
jgi:hypothetical protein